MKQAVFNYPKEFVTLPDYTAHAGQTVEVLRELSQADACDVPLKADGTYEPEPHDVERMFRIQAADGWQGDAFLSELTAV